MNSRISHKGSGYLVFLAIAAAALMVANAQAAEPTITGLSPSSELQGAQAFTLVITGTGFADDSVVQWNGTERPTTFVRSTQLNASIPASDLATAGTANITVLNPSTEEISAAKTFTIKVGPVPRISSLLPTSAKAGSSGITLTVLGTNFQNGSKIHWNGEERITTFFSTTTLDAAISATDLSSPGTANVTVVNPGPDTSNTINFIVQTNTPAPTITSLDPNFATAGGPEFILTVTGTNFTETTVVLWNGEERPTTFLNSTTLSATIPATDIAQAGTATIRVFETAPGGNTSNGVTFPIEAFSTLYFPQVAVGGGYTTVLAIVNTASTQANATLVLTEQSGTPFLVNLTERTGGTVASTFQFTVPAGATRIFTLSAPGAGDPTKSGSARVESTEGNLSGVATFKRREGNTLLSAAGVLASRPVDEATIPVDNSQAEGRFTGFSVFNPANENINLRVVVIDENGTVLESLNPLELNPLGPQMQVTRFLHEYLQARSTFRGSMVLVSQGDKRFVPVALVQELTEQTAIPVVPAKPASVPSF